MANLFKHAFIDYMVACLTIVAFTTTTLTLPSKLLGTEAAIDLGKINFGIKIEKLFEKIKKAIDKGDTNKIVDYMFDIKSEVESYTGKYIDIAKQIDAVQQQAKTKGKKIDDKYIKLLKKEFQHIDKKHQHRALYMAQCIEANTPYSTSDADWNFDQMTKNSKDKVDGEMRIPITITVGVTVSLCGLFLLIVPIPICTTAGGYMLEAGIGILSSYALDKWDEYDRQQHDK